MRRSGVLWSVVAIFVVLSLLTVFALELANTQAKSRRDVIGRVHERGTLASALIDSLFQASASSTPHNARTYGTATVSDRTVEGERKTNEYLALLNADGTVLAQSRGFTAQAAAQLPRSRALAPVRAGQAYGLGDLEPYGKTGVIDFAVVVPTPYGKRYLVSGIAPKVLDAFITGELRRIPGVKGSHNYLIDGGNAVIASTNPRRPAGYVFRTPEQVRTLAQKSGSANGFQFVQTPLSDSAWRVVLASPKKALFASVSGLRKWVPWMIFIAFALVAAIAFLLARRALAASEQVRDSYAQLGLLNAELATTNDALARRAAELGRSNDELDQFASIASHDLQEPLRKVRTFTQQLTVIEADRLSDKGRDYLLRTNAAAERMQRLIEDLLRFSRVATQNRPFAPVDLDVVTHEVLGDLEHEVEVSGAIIRVGDLPTINGDATQMRQLMQNLLSNAMKFRRPGVTPEVDVEAAVGGDVASIVVRDNGIGFEPQYEQRIFRVFERLHGRTEYPGTGIGLALCRKIAERHGGHVQAASVPGEGSTFTITLPLHQHEEVVVIGTRDPDREHVRSVEEHAHA